MKTLAEVLVFMMERIFTAEEPGIDRESCGDLVLNLLAELANGSATEREAIVAAADARLAELLREPDEYGYTPRALVTPAQKDFLQSLADGSVWQEFDDPGAAAE